MTKNKYNFFQYHQSLRKRIKIANEIPLDTHQNDSLKRPIPSVGKDVEQLELLYRVGRNLKYIATSEGFLQN